MNISKNTIDILHFNKILLSHEDDYIDENFINNVHKKLYISSFIRKSKLHGLNDDEIYKILKDSNELSNEMIKLIISETLII